MSTTAEATPETTARTALRGRILLVDDDEQVCGVLAEILARGGFDVLVAHDGDTATRHLAEHQFDVVLSDISMPRMDGIALLRNVREAQSRIPVVLMTGKPEMKSAIDAVALSAFRYIVKPFSTQDILEALDRAVEQRRADADRGDAAPVPAASTAASEEAALTRAIATLRMAYQPIVSCRRRDVFGYEALARPTEPALPHPGALFAAAEKQGRLADLGRAVRRAVAGAAPSLPRGVRFLFVNIHPQELLDDELYNASSPLSRFADHVVLEITERAAIEAIGDLSARVSALRHLGYRIAVDDLGAGYAGLTMVAALQPDVVKFDLSLVRDIQDATVKQKLVGSMNEVCRGLGMLTIAEGVELPAQRETLEGIGCDLQQGFLYARPAPVFPPAVF